MEKSLLEDILNELSDVNTNLNNNYDHYDSQLSDLERVLKNLLELAEKQIEQSDTIINRLDYIMQDIPSVPNLDGFSDKLAQINSKMDNANSLLKDISYNTDK